MNLAAGPQLVVQHDDDATLVARICACEGGDRAAFRALYRRHSRYVAGVVYRLMGNDADLEDIVQDTFVRAAERLDSLRAPSQVRAWLVTIAVRFARGRMAKRRRRYWLRRDIAHVSAQSADPQDRGPVEDLYAALSQVPDRMRVPWLLARVEGYKLDEVAAICEVSLATVKRRISDAQTRLDRRLAPASTGLQGPSAAPVVSIAAHAQRGPGGMKQ